jgi:hypothetical protein
MKKKKASPKEEIKIYKCYKCGYTSGIHSQHCPKCLIEGLNINMLLLIEK